MKDTHVRTAAAVVAVGALAGSLFVTSHHAKPAPTAAATVASTPTPTATPTPTVTPRSTVQPTVTPRSR